MASGKKVHAPSRTGGSERKIPYRNYSSFLRERYGGKIMKICIDGGFTCPNRDGTCGTGGCIFCGARGAGEHIAGGRAITEQVEKFLAHTPKAAGYIAYFQNFTNTYAPVGVLRERYGAALTDSRIRALAVGTRPDCISAEIADLLASYRPARDVWVELGLQTASDETALRINRGYETARFAEAVQLLSSRGIPAVVHIMIGLPGEGLAELARTVEYISGFDLWGIKIHSVYVMQGTVLEQMYRTGAYRPLTLEEYTARAAYVLRRIPPEMVVHRLTGDCPPALLCAPDWNRDKNRVIAEINRIMDENGWSQGCEYAGHRSCGRKQA